MAANLFPVWLVLAAGVALWRPALLSGLSKDAVTAGLAACMLAMGTTLTVEDFVAVGKRPGLVALGAALQYTIMPALGFGISRALRLPTPYAVGLCLVACCPGGVASNVVTFLACADVPLSVCMTTVSTLAAAVMTPALTGLLVGTLVPVDTVGLLVSTLQVVLLPIAAGAWLNRAFPAAVQRAAPFAPLVAVACTVAVCASVLARNAAAVTAAGPVLLGAIAALHVGGFGLGYTVSRAAGIPERQARTNSIEVGMQNSALGAVLATLHFADPLTPIPGAISACMHSVLGSALAGFWRFRDARAARRGLGDVDAAGPGGDLGGDLASSRAQAQQWIVAWRGGRGTLR